MDQKTLKAYADRANTYSQDWLNQPEPSDMYKLLQKYFIPGGSTVDIGCGNGRDAGWLQQQGFKVQGYDSSTELLAIAKDLFPQIPFAQAFLPALTEVQGQFDNVLCETVIMHLPLGQIPEALQSLKRLLKGSGVLYLSWRVTEGADARNNDGRLYTAFEPAFILDQFPKNFILHFEDKISSSSGKRTCRMIYRNT